MAVHDQMLSPPASEVTVLDPANGHVLDREQLHSAHLAEGITPVPTRGWMLNSMVRVRNLVPITQVKDGWVMSTGLAISQEDGEVTQIPLDEANAYFSDPSGVVASPDGKRAYVASGGADVVTVLDLDRLGAWLTQADAAARSDAIGDMALSYRYVVARIPTGCNPRHLALSPDGRRLFVAERLDDRVLVVDTTSLKPIGRIVLGDGGRNDPIRQGERVFTRAKYTFQGQFSCRSCHPDGHVDGLSYDFDGSGVGDNLLDNRSLCGVAGTAPFKWNGKNPTLQFQDGPRFARVLMRTDPIPSAATGRVGDVHRASPADAHDPVEPGGPAAHARGGTRPQALLRDAAHRRHADSPGAPMPDLPSAPAVHGPAAPIGGHASGPRIRRACLTRRI